MIPADHYGLDYNAFLPALIKKRNVKRYLEIGISEGQLLSKIEVPYAVGVDPSMHLNQNVTAGKETLVLHQITSDKFFADKYLTKSLGGEPDLAFLDGYHTFEFLLRDFYNTERLSHKGSLIVMHDCLPLTEEMAHRNEATSQHLSVGRPFQGYWTGDVWKIIPILKEFRPDLRLVAINSRPTGLLCVSSLNPLSTFLKDSYFDIVDKYKDVPNNVVALSNMYENLVVIETADVLNDFDHSLFFRV